MAKKSPKKKAKGKRETNKELIKEYTTLYDLIYNTECFGGRDLQRLDQLEEKLEKRGIEITEYHTPTFREVD